MTRSAVKANKLPIPTFRSRAEEAEFWDTHDLTDYFDFETEPVGWKIDGPFSEPVTLRIDLETMEEVRAHAAARDMPPDVLLQIWILERRDAERQRRAAEAEPADRATASAPAVTSGTAPA